MQLKYYHQSPSNVPIVDCNSPMIFTNGQANPMSNFAETYKAIGRTLAIPKHQYLKLRIDGKKCLYLCI